MGTHMAKLSCPHCSAPVDDANWWAEFLDKNGWGEEQCKSCGQWFGVTCKIIRKWSTRIIKQPPEIN